MWRHESSGRAVVDELRCGRERDGNDTGQARQDGQQPAQPQTPGQESPARRHGQARQRTAGERRERARQYQDDSRTADRLPHLVAAHRA